MSKDKARGTTLICLDRKSDKELEQIFKDDMKKRGKMFSGTVTEAKDGGLMAATAKPNSKSLVNEAGNYTKPALRKRLVNKSKAGTTGGKAGQWSARKAQLLASEYKKAGGGYKS